MRIRKKRKKKGIDKRFKKKKKNKQKRNKSKQTNKQTCKQEKKKQTKREERNCETKNTTKNVKATKKGFIYILGFFRDFYNGFCSGSLFGWRVPITQSPHRANFSIYLCMCSRDFISPFAPHFKKPFLSPLPPPLFFLS